MSISSVNISTVQAATWIHWSACSFTDALAVFRLELTQEIVNTVEPTYLQADELDRSHRYRRPADRNRFAYARHLLRLLLGQYCDQPPETIRFIIGQNGKPQLTGTEAWYMNLTHGGNWILVVIGTTNVGIDLEQVNPSFSFQDLLPTSFSVSEQQHIQSSNHPHLAFYQLWTRKEALAKATAKGIDDDFSKIPSLTGTHTINSLLLGSTDDWMVQSVSIANDYMASVAYATTSTSPKFYTVDSGFFTHFTS